MFNQGRAFHGSGRPERPLRTAGDPLHLPLLQTVHPLIGPQVAFRTPAQWARRLVAGSVDAVLVSVAGDPRQEPAAFLPRLEHPGVEAIALGRRPLLLLHYPGSAAGAGLSRLDGDGGVGAGSAASCSASGAALGAEESRWPPRGYLLPPRDHQPGLHQLLEHSGQLPLRCTSAADPAQWLAQLVAEPLLLPADLTLLTIAPWRGAGLVPLRPLSPLVEALWLLLRRGEASQPQLRQLAAWWGGQGVQLPPVDPPAERRQGIWGWRWWRP